MDFVVRRPLFVRVVAVVAMAAAILVPASDARSAGNAGDIDVTFAEDGTYSNPDVGGTGDIIVASDGRLYIPVRGSTPGAGAQILRLTSDGVVDEGYGTDGFSDLVFSDVVTPGSIRAIVQQSDGKIVGVGNTAGGGGRSGAAVRFDTDGTLDTSFGTDGVALWDFGEQGEAGYDTGFGVTLDADGKVVIVGASDSGCLILRLDTDGSVDPDFTPVVVNTIAGPSNEILFGVIVEPDGRITAAGSNNDTTYSQSDIVLIRTTDDGTLDTTFGSDGVVVEGHDGLTGGSALVRSNDGSYVVAAGGKLARFSSTGALDETFGGDGVADTGLGSLARLEDLVIDGSGRYVAVGRHFRPYGSDPFDHPLVVRVLDDGSFDSAFGTDGISEPETALTRVRAVAPMSDGRLVMSGSGSGGVAFRILSEDLPNTIPTANDDGPFELLEGGSVDGNVLDNDVDPDSETVLTATLVTDAAHGAVSLESDGEFLYEVDSGYVGSDSFTYIANDGSDDSDVATVSFEISAIPNVPPVANDDGPFGLFEGGNLTGNVLVNDSDDKSALTAHLVTATTHGTIDLVSNGAFSYTPDLGFVGDDSFTYVANDGEDDSNVATVTFEVMDIADPAPIANDDGPFDVLAGESVDGNVLENDSGVGAPLTARLATSASHGTVSLDTSGGFTYKADAGFTGTDSFTYIANNGGDDSNEAVVRFNVAAQPTPELGPPSVGLVDPTTGVWSLDLDGGARSFYYGNPGDIPFMGDWDCDGIDTPGLFRQSDAFAYLRNSNSEGIADVRFFFGNPSDIPIAGDFNGDGCDTLSIYRPSEAKFYIVNKLGKNDGGLGAADDSFLFGNVGDKPVVGDWDGDGVDEIGLHRESTGFFYWRDTLTTGNADGAMYFGDPGDRFVTGDWLIADGRDTPAIYRPSDATFYFRSTLTQGNADATMMWPLAQPHWVPVAGVFK